MKISTEIFEWLVRTEVIPPEGFKVAGGKIEIPKQVALEFENGSLFAKLIKITSKIISSC